MIARMILYDGDDDDHIAIVVNDDYDLRMK